MLKKLFEDVNLQLALHTTTFAMHFCSNINNGLLTPTMGLAKKTHDSKIM